MVYLYIILLSYFLGTFPTALIIVKLFTGKDVRDNGSGNMGAINTLRTVGKQQGPFFGLLAFLIVGFIDMGKAVLSVYLTRFFLYQNNPLGITIATFFVILGHNYPFFLKFYGGRGAASLAGIFIYLDNRIFFIWLLTIFVFIIVTEFIFNIFFKKKTNFKFVLSAISEQIIGRLLGEIIVLVFIYLINKEIFFPALAGTFLIIVRHKKRIIQQLKIYNKKI